MNKKLIVPILIAGAAAFCAIGSTYALFTSKDEANIAITAGKVNAKAELVDLVVYSGAANSLTGDPVADEPNIVAQAGTTFANGGTASISNGTLTLTGMTPGDRVSLKIKVTNNSNVSVKGRTSFTMSSNDGLFAALKVKIDGEDFNGLARYGNWAEVTDDVQYIDVVVDFPSDKTMDFGDKSCSINFAYDMLQLNAHTVDPEPNTVQLSSANDLVMFSNLVDAGELFTDQTVKLTNNIDLAGVEWNPIGELGFVVFGANVFDGIFDGCGYTISNMTVTDNKSAGLFAEVGSIVRNVVIDGANIVSNHYAGGIAGHTENGNNTLIENCVVKNSSITSSAEFIGDEWDNGDKVGGITGYTASNPTIKNCKVENVNIKGYRDLGGLVGFASTGSFIGNSVKDVNIAIDNSHNYKNYDSYAKNDAGEIIGENAGGTFDDPNTNTATNVTISAEVADGFAMDMTSGEYSVSSKAGMTAFASLVNAGTETFAGKTIKLLADVDLSGSNWTPIGSEVNYGGFAGTFDGNGKVIKNMTVVQSGTNGAAGLFAACHAGTIKNVTIDNANISGEHYAGGIVGWFEGNGYAVVENCVVKNSTIVLKTWDKGTEWEDGDKAGGIAGYVCYSAVKNCTVTNCSITAYRDLGSIAGLMHSGGIITGNTASNVTLVNDRTHNYKGYTTDAAYDVNDVIGEVAGGTQENNTATSITKQVIGA